jgi:RNA polymerase sigma factor (sigma-70 family)
VPLLDTLWAGDFVTDQVSSAAIQADLLVRATQGEARAARDLTALLAPRAYAQAFRMLGNTAEAEDVVQDALMRLWRAAPNWQAGGAQVSTWLYRVVANLCIDRMRRSKHVSLQDEDTPEPQDPGPGQEAQLIQKARLSALYAALRKLPDRQRQAVVLRHIEGLSNPEIAEIMEVSVEAVESLSARGKRALSKDLGPHKKELGFSDER